MWDGDNFKSQETSYVITLAINIDSFCEILYQNYYHRFFGKEELEKQIDRRIKDLNTYAENIKEEDVSDLIQEFEKEIKVWKTMRKELLDYDHNSLVLMALELDQISVEVNDEEITLIYENTLHYSYASSIPEIFIEIMLFFTLHPDLKCQIKGTTHFDLEVV